ncbi:dimethyl sulfoxide reductase anchor subunit family protein [Oleidesulfovibrio sp.]|uniref:dimethyl sulfoxide reductase anchor subunit family protein n=1 Tax=Oleidesulfovibrio sp. TaxID=2909707 RepID=UPI003A8BC57D
MHITSVSLIVFTVLMQTAAGLVLAAELARTDDAAEQSRLALCLPVALGLGIFSLMFASTHLASPLAAVYVLNNVFSSALSFEIFCCSLFIGLMAVTLFLRLKGLELASLFGKLSAAAGLVAVYSIARVYMQETMPTLDTGGTLLSFLGTGLLVGGVLGMLLYSLKVKNTPAEENSFSPAKVFITVALLGFGLEFIALPLNMMARSFEGAYGTTGLQMMLSTATAACLPYSNALIVAGLLACLWGWAGSLKKSYAAPLVRGSMVGFVCVLAGSLAVRYFFYESYIRLGI